MKSFKVQTVRQDDSSDRSCTCHFTITPWTDPEVAGESYNVTLDDVTGEYANDISDDDVEAERVDISNAINRNGVMLISHITG